jgi:protein TonB
VFENYVSQGKASWKRRTLFIASIVAHVGAGIGLLIYSVFHVEELPPPEVTLTFFNAPPPPPPPPPPPAGATQQKKASTKPKIVPTKTALIQPKTKEEKEEKPEKNEPAGEPGGVQGGVAGGVQGGVVGGVVGGVPTHAPPPPPPPAPTAAPAPVAPKMVPSFVFDKERINAPDPHLPESFMNRHPKETFNATYRICVGTDGRITEASAVHPIGGVDDDVLGQIRRTWLYKPQPLPVCSMRVFVFKIN